MISYEFIGRGGMRMNKYDYVVMHIPGTACSCKDKKEAEFTLTTELMTPLQFFQTLARWNYLGRGHWQYWC